MYYFKIDVALHATFNGMQQCILTLLKLQLEDEKGPDSKQEYCTNDKCFYYSDSTNLEVGFYS